MCFVCVALPTNTSLPADPEIPILIVVPTGAVIASLIIIGSIVSGFLVRRRGKKLSRSKVDSNSTFPLRSRMSKSELARDKSLPDNIRYGSPAQNIYDLPPDSFIASPTQVPPTTVWSAGQESLTSNLNQHNDVMEMTRNPAYDHLGNRHSTNNFRQPSLEQDEEFDVKTDQEYPEYSYIAGDIIQNCDLPRLQINSPPSLIQYDVPLDSFIASPSQMAPTAGRPAAQVPVTRDLG